ncbi:hypothetical protein ACFLU5_02740 [Bacteroidota bacterium]
MKKLFQYLLVCFIVFLFPIYKITAQSGNTTIAKWKDDKKGAYSLRFDDSMWSHRDHTIPNLVKRGLVGTFYVNPANERYGYGIDSWESLVGRVGIEICPHSMNHTGAADFEEADYEIGEAYRTVWRLNPPDKSKLYPFSRGGGTTWPSGYREAVLNKYPVANFSNDGVRYPGDDDKKQLIDFAKKAMKDNAWHYVLTHGTGPDLEWLGFEVSNFEALLDYLESVKDKLWVGNVGDIHKYVTERNSAKVKVKEAKNSIIRLDLTSDVDGELYDYPLTLITEVPSDWKYCHISQGALQSIIPVKSGKVMYEALPDRGDIILEKSSMDTTPPGNVVVRDGTGEDIDATLFTTRISTNWDEAEDAESGISRYWYKIGTTPGGSEVLDWIDNGLVRKISTSRTNFSLVRGEKYYITVKAVNGVGLSSESTSDGFIVNSTPDLIVFNENFDNGYLSQWDEKRARYGSDRNQIYISDLAAREGKYGIQCHFEETQTGSPYFAKHNLKENEVAFTRFYVKLSPDFNIPSDGGSVQLLELRDASGGFVAGVYISYVEGIGMHIFARSRDKAYTSSLPGWRKSYPMGFVHIDKDKWHRIDVKTVAHNGKGSAEFWFDGSRKSCITNRFTAGMAVRSLYLGTMNTSESITGEIFIDDVTVSDSFLK